MKNRRRTSFTEVLSPGGWIISIAAILSTIAICLWDIPKREGQPFWIFSKTHKLMYDPATEIWNKEHQPINEKVHLLLISGGALQRRLLSGFMSGTPLPSLVEVHAQIAAQAFKGPLDNVGFLDITDRLRDEGIYEQINPPSFGPWTSRGRIFGLPHDVHPVLLAYRSDIVEAAGIDVNDIETWDDFKRLLKPLMKDNDGDGYPDRYLLNFWETDPELIEVLMLQAGGCFFDENEQLDLASEINARVLAEVICWTTGPGRIAVNAPEFDAAGNKMRIDGTVLASLMADWLTGAWKMDLGVLAGKVKLMPLPAWDKGGCRTSVRGGTMLGIPKATPHIEQAWAYAKYLYLSKELAEKLYLEAGIISPVRANWTNAVYDQPSAFFSGQAPGRLYINAAPDVPMRTSSPYNDFARARVADAALALKEYAETQQIFDVKLLIPKALEYLTVAQERTQIQVDRNVFLKKEVL